MKTDFGNIVWNFFMLPFFIGGGVILITASVMMNDLMYLIIGLMGVGLGIFFIWLNKNYDLDDTTIHGTCFCDECVRKTLRMIDYPMEECVSCKNLFRADGDVSSCAECGEPLCDACGYGSHEEICEGTT
jgi:hypothetical protein